MKLTHQTNYAVRMLMYCRAKEELATVGEISEFYGLSEGFLTKILHTLADRGYVETVRGRNGGFRLARRGSEIRLGELVKDIEENFELAECFQPGDSGCPLVSSCGLNQALSGALGSFFEALNRYTLDDLAQKKHRISDLLRRPRQSRSASVRPPGKGFTQKLPHSLG